MAVALICNRAGKFTVVQVFQVSKSFILKRKGGGHLADPLIYCGILLLVVRAGVTMHVFRANW